MRKDETVKLISAEGFEFVIPKEAAMVSQTIRNMLTSPGGFAEAQHGEVTFPEITAPILEKICQYFHWSLNFARGKETEFAIEPELTLELMMAANYLHIVLMMDSEEETQVMNVILSNGTSHFDSHLGEVTPLRMESQDIQDDDDDDDGDGGGGGSGSGSDTDEFAYIEEEFVQPPCIGMEFATEELAYTYYNAYAKQRGFGIRKGWIDKSRKNKEIIIRRQFYAINKAIKI